MPRSIWTVERTVCATENATESRSAVSNTFHNDMGKRNPYQSEIRRRRPEPTPASFFLWCTIHHICEGQWRQCARNAHASTTYGMWRI